MKPKFSNEKYQARLDKVPEIEFARLAAYIDGEGCINISSCEKPRGRGMSKTHEMKVTVTNTYLPLFTWISSNFGGLPVPANSNSKKSTSKKMCWRWVLAEIKSEMILRRCLPYFVIKAEQAKIALAFRDIKRRKYGESRNGKLTQAVIRERDVLQQKISALNSVKGFGAKKNLNKALTESEQTVN